MKRLFTPPILQYLFISQNYYHSYEEYQYLVLYVIIMASSNEQQNTTTITNNYNNITNHEHIQDGHQAIKSSPSSSSTKTEEKHPMQSIAVISIAGFGGAIAGLAMSRRGRGGMGALQSLQHAPPTMHHVQNVSSQLPLLWAMGCATFAGIIEFSTLVSPTNYLLCTLRNQGFLTNSIDKSDACSISSSSSRSINLNVNDDDCDSHENVVTNKKNEMSEMILAVEGQLCDYWDDESISTLGDYAMGGALAGALFKGSQIRPSMSNATQYQYQHQQNISNMTSIKPIIKPKSVMTSGYGKVVTLANKDEYRLRKKNRNSTRNNNNNNNSGGNSKISNNSNNGNTTRTIPSNNNNNINNGKILNNTMKLSKVRGGGIMSGLIPGIFLGLFAGLLQIGISKIHSIALEYDAKLKEEHYANKEITENDAIDKDRNDEDDEIVKQVKSMSMDQIKHEISLLKGEVHVDKRGNEK